VCHASIVDLMVDSLCVAYICICVAARYVGLGLTKCNIFQIPMDFLTEISKFPLREFSTDHSVFFSRRLVVIGQLN
jgi:hypothetical protein